VPLATSLAELRGPLEKSYRNTIYCAHRLVQEGDQLRADVAGGAGGYCGNRWCLVCSRVRIARAITRYAPAIEGWRGYMVTLTIPNVGAAELPGAIEGMHRAFTAAKRAIKRTDRITFRALRKLECTHNQVRGDFHPHFHVIVDGEAGARALVRRWLEAYPEAVAAAQDVRPCGAGSAKELFKYFTKLVTKVQTKGGAVISRVTPPEALDVIFRAMRGRRVWQPVGFKAPPATDEDAPIGTDGDTEAPEYRARTVWTWEQGATDWVDRGTGECLTGYKPAEGFRRFVDGISSPPPPPPGAGGGVPPAYIC
jgi:hypothetical protein